MPRFEAYCERTNEVISMHGNYVDKGEATLALMYTIKHFAHFHCNGGAVSKDGKHYTVRQIKNNGLNPK